MKIEDLLKSKAEPMPASISNAPSNEEINSTSHDDDNTSYDGYVHIEPDMDGNLVIVDGDKFDADILKKSIKSSLSRDVSLEDKIKLCKAFSLPTDIFKTSDTPSLIEAAVNSDVSRTIANRKVTNPPEVDIGTHAEQLLPDSTPVQDDFFSISSNEGVKNQDHDPSDDDYEEDEGE